MVKDLILDMDERDLSFVDKSLKSYPEFDTFWGPVFIEDKEASHLICNIIIPEAYWKSMTYTDNELIVRFKSAYIPNKSDFRVRLVALRDSRYNLFSAIRGKFGLPAISSAVNRNVAMPIPACMLPLVDIDGQLLARFVRNESGESLDRAFIYSAKATDIEIDYSDDQSARLLSVCAPGKNYRYPTTGVGITNYLNTVISHSDFFKNMQEQFSADGRPLISASFDSTTCDLDVIFTPEEALNDAGLTPVTELDTDFFKRFDDDFVRRNTVLSDVDESEFINMLDNYPNIYGLFLFTDETTDLRRMDENVKPGRFGGKGNVIEDEDNYIISATLDTGTIVMFNNEEWDSLEDAPIFVVNDTNHTRLYTSLVGQPEWVTQNCHKCFVLKKRAVVQYAISRKAFKAGKGLFTVRRTSPNIKNLLALVQDEVTGRLAGIISNNTNISSVTLDEVTRHIYAAQTTYSNEQ